MQALHVIFLNIEPGDHRILAITKDISQFLPGGSQLFAVDATVRVDHDEVVLGRVVNQRVVVQADEGCHVFADVVDGGLTLKVLGNATCFQVSNVVTDLLHSEGVQVLREAEDESCHSAVTHQEGLVVRLNVPFFTKSLR